MKNANEKLRWGQLFIFHFAFFILHFLGLN